jgi:HrpA-like RNA helicase
MVKFLTDGMLIQEMMADPLLNQYSVVMVDDMHERSLNTDMILGLLKKLPFFILGSGEKEKT